MKKTNKKKKEFDCAMFFLNRLNMIKQEIKKSNLGSKYHLLKMLQLEVEPRMTKKERQKAKKLQREIERKLHNYELFIMKRTESFGGKPK